MRLVVTAIVSLTLMLASNYSYAVGMEDAINVFSHKLAGYIVDNNLKRVGIPEFANSSGDLGGDTGAAGQFMADCIEEQLVKASQGQYTVVERRRLNAVLSEGKVQSSGLTDEKASHYLMGKISNLDCLVVGSLTRTGRTLRLTGKIVRLPDAANVGIESATIELNADLLTLFGENVVLPETENANQLSQEKVVSAGQQLKTLRLKSVIEDANPYTIEVIANGRSKSIYQHKDDLFIPAITGESYAIKLTNRSMHRVAVALFIDGLNTIGQQREVPSTGKKWLLEPNQSVLVSGWQVDEKTCRQFIFVGASKSLAARKFYTEQIGLITAAFYPEMQPDRTAPASGEETRGLGTGEGNDIQQDVQPVEFLTAPNPIAILALHYDAKSIVEKYSRLER